MQYAVVEASDRAALVDAWKEWMQEHVTANGAVPPGNETGNTTWTGRRARKQKADLRMTPGPNTQLTVPLQEVSQKHPLP